MFNTAPGVGRVERFSINCTSFFYADSTPLPEWGGLKVFHSIKESDRVWGEFNTAPGVGRVESIGAKISILIFWQFQHRSRSGAG